MIVLINAFPTFIFELKNYSWVNIIAYVLVHEYLRTNRVESLTRKQKSDETSYLELMGARSGRTTVRLRLLRDLFGFVNKEDKLDGRRNKLHAVILGGLDEVFFCPPSYLFSDLRRVYYYKQVQFKLFASIRIFSQQVPTSRTRVLYERSENFVRLIKHLKLSTCKRENCICMYVSNQSFSHY